MKKLLCMSLLLPTLFFTVLGLTVPGQDAANRVYGNQGAQQGGDVFRRKPAYPETSSELIVTETPNLLVTTYQFLDARILTTVDTREYVAVFGLAQEARS